MSPPKRVREKFRVPSTSPPFTKADLKKAIPPHCFERSTFKSTLYLVNILFLFSILVLTRSNDNFNRSQI